MLGKTNPLSTPSIRCLSEVSQTLPMSHLLKVHSARMSRLKVKQISHDSSSEKKEASFSSKSKNELLTEKRWLLACSWKQSENEPQVQGTCRNQSRTLGPHCLGEILQWTSQQQGQHPSFHNLEWWKQHYPQKGTVPPPPPTHPPTERPPLS